MARTRVRWGRVATLGVAAGLLVGAAGGAAHAGAHAEGAAEHATEVRTCVVEPGDTLWAIAVRIAGPQADPRPLVEALAAANHTDGSLLPGQTLVIPAA